MQTQNYLNTGPKNSINMQVMQCDVLEDNQYTTSECQRANLLIEWLARQQEQKMREITYLEKQIMDKGGVDDGALWDRMLALRSDVDKMYHEKL
jgi:hypothetical protein